MPTQGATGLLNPLVPLHGCKKIYDHAYMYLQLPTGRHSHLRSTTPALRTCSAPHDCIVSPFLLARHRGAFFSCVSVLFRFVLVYLVAGLPNYFSFCTVYCCMGIGIEIGVSTGICISSFQFGFVFMILPIARRVRVRVRMDVAVAGRAFGWVGSYWTMTVSMTMIVGTVALELELELETKMEVEVKVLVFLCRGTHILYCMLLYCTAITVNVYVNLNEKV